MSNISVYGRHCSIPESKQYQDRSSIEPQSQQQLSNRPPDYLINSNCTSEESAEAVKPICASETEGDNAVTDPHLQCAAPQPSYLLALPIELRLRILHFALPYSRPDDIYRYIWHFASTSILRTCHQLHEEGTTVLYSSNTFQIQVLPGKQLNKVRSASTGVVSVLTVDFKLWFYEHYWDLVPTYRCFLEPIPMRLEDLRLIRRWEIHISRIYPYMKTKDCYDPFKVALVVQDHVLSLLNGILQGIQDSRKVRVRWSGAACEVHSDKHRETILKPLRDKGTEVEEVFDLW